MGSDVARVMQQIEEETEAAHRMFSGMSEGSSRHAFLTAQTERISREYVPQLKALVEQQQKDAATQ